MQANGEQQNRTPSRLTACDDRHRGAKFAKVPASLVAEDLSWGPPGAANILENVSFALPAGQVLGVLGPNGAGKSTLLRLLYRYLRPRAGRAWIDGTDIWSISARAAARLSAVVVQEQPATFSLTVREVVELGRAPFRSLFAAGGDRSAELVESAMERLNLGMLSHRCVGTLSGGERQRVMFARALVQEPRVLILDEPTNHLDIRYRLELLELVKELGLTVVCSLHDLDAAVEHADKALVLSKGRVAAFGDPESALSSHLVSSVYFVSAKLEELSVSGRRRFSFQLN